MFEYFKNPNCEWITSASTWKRSQVDAYWWTPIIWGNEIIAVRSVETAVTVLLVVLFPEYVRWAVRAPDTCSTVEENLFFVWPIWHEQTCWAVSTTRPSGLRRDYYFISVLLGCVGSLWHLNGASGSGGSWQTPSLAGRRIELGLTKPRSCV